MRILYLVYDITRCGGVQRVTSLMANRLSSEFDICILSLCNLGTEPYFPLEANVRTEHLFEGSVRCKRDFIKLVGALRAFYRRNPDFDVLVDNEMGIVPLSYFGFRSAKGMKRISIDHTNFSACKTFSLAWFGKRLACRTSNAVVVLTRQDYEDYRAGIRKIRRLEQCYNLREEIPLLDSFDADTRQIMSCGRFVPHKGFDMLVEVARLVLPEFPDWQWHIFGDGKDFEFIQSRIREYGLQDQLILKGYSENLADRYPEYSLFVLTSRMEGMAVVLVEAQVNRLPVVSFDCKNGPRELIEDGQNGYLVDCFDTQKMAERLRDLMGNREKRIRFSGKAQQQFHKLDPQTITDKWRNLFRSI